MSHYIKTTMDCIFGKKNFRNEITWQRAGGSAKGSQYEPKRFGCDVDSIFYYSRSDQHVLGDIYLPLSPEEMNKRFPHTDEQGRRYHTTTPIFCSPSMGHRPNLCYTYKGVTNPYPSGWRVSKARLESMDQNGEIIWREGKNPLRKSFASDYKGKSLGSLWTDIPNVTVGKESLNYSTQKPVALLERIIKASSKEGDMVLDPFCGCATTCVAAERLDRKWIGIDVSKKAHDLVKKRLIKEAATEDDMFKYQNEIIFKIDPPKRTDQGEDHRERKYVYVISNRHFPGEYKVGIAKDPKGRLNQYQTSDPARAYKIEFKHQTPAFRETEAHIHTQFDNKHEWVTGNLAEIINAIKTFKH